MKFRVLLRNGISIDVAAERFALDMDGSYVLQDEDSAHVAAFPVDVVDAIIRVDSVEATPPEKLQGTTDHYKTLRW